MTATVGGRGTWPLGCLVGVMTAVVGLSSSPGPAVATVPTTSTTSYGYVFGTTATTAPISSATTEHPTTTGTPGSSTSTVVYHSPVTTTTVATYPFAAPQEPYPTTTEPLPPPEPELDLRTGPETEASATPEVPPLATGAPPDPPLPTSSGPATTLPAMALAPTVLHRSAPPGAVAAAFVPAGRSTGGGPSVLWPAVLAAACLCLLGTPGAARRIRRPPPDDAG